jgi:hypothetical protein
MFKTTLPPSFTSYQVRAAAVGSFEFEKSFFKSVSIGSVIGFLVPPHDQLLLTIIFCPH